MESEKWALLESQWLKCGWDCRQELGVEGGSGCQIEEGGVSSDKVQVVQLHVRAPLGRGLEVGGGDVKLERVDGQSRAHRPPPPPQSGVNGVGQHGE